VGLTACIETEPPTTSTTSTTVPSTTTTRVPTPSESLTVWVDRPRYDLAAHAAAAFSSASGTDVEVSAVSFEDILSAVLDGEGPDVFLASHENLGEFLRDGLVSPVELGEIRFELDPVAVDAISDAGESYGVPYGMEAIGLFAHGNGPAPTFGDIAAAGRRVGLPDGWFHGYGFMSASGGYVFGASIDDVGVVDGAAGLAALEGLIAGGTVVAASYADVTDRFASGDLDYLMTGPWQVGPFEDDGVEFTVLPLPTVEGMRLRPLVGVQAFFVSSDANPKLAASYVREVLETVDVLAGSAAADGRVPAYLPARANYPFPAFVESVDNGDLIPAVPEMALAWDALTALFDQIDAGLHPSLADTETEIRRVVAP
jgi:arabinogalactan oligomer / maltooligosaccharide transport system substrate-binding protein